MKLRNRGNYYVPNLVNQLTGKIDEYYMKEDDVFLYFILEQISSNIEELFTQYPMCSDEEEIERLLVCQARFARSLGISSDCCYHYFGKKDKVFQGITVGSSVQDEVIPIKITTTDIMKGGPTYQRRVEVMYDKEEEYFIPKSVVEVEKSNGVVIQSDFSPKTLGKVRKYVRY